MSDTLFYIIVACLIGAVLVACTAQGLVRAGIGLAAAFVAVGALFIAYDAVAVGLVEIVAGAGCLWALVRAGLAGRGSNRRAVADTPSRRRLPAMIAAIAVVSVLATVAWTVPAWRTATLNTQPAASGGIDTIAAILGGDLALVGIVVLAVVLVAIAGTVLVARAGHSGADPISNTAPPQ